MNQCGKWGPHFEAALKEFGFLLGKRCTWCCMLQGPFTVPPFLALSKVLSCWGSRLAYLGRTREHVAHVVRAVETHNKASTTFLPIVHGQSTGGRRRMGGYAIWQSNGRAGPGWIPSGVLTSILTAAREELLWGWETGSTFKALRCRLILLRFSTWLRIIVVYAILDSGCPIHIVHIDSIQYIV